MNPRHSEFAPFNTSFVTSTRFQNGPPSNGGGRGGMWRRHRRPQPPVLQYPHQIPLTRQPMGFPMYQPSFGSPPPMSHAPSWLPYYPPPQPVAPHNYNAALPLPPFIRPPTTSSYSGGNIPPRYAHGRGNRNNVSGSSSLWAPQSAERFRIYSEPQVEVPVRVMPNEYFHGEAYDVMNVLLTDYMDPDKISYVYSEDDLEIIFRDSGSENRSEDTAGHSEFGLSDPRRGKRILANEESCACSNAKKARRGEYLDEQEQIERLTGEDPQLATGAEVFPNDSAPNMEPLDPNMFQMDNQLDPMFQINLDLDFDEDIIKDIMF